jgi:hypothetical protein
VAAQLAPLAARSLIALLLLAAPAARSQQAADRDTDPLVLVKRVIDSRYSQAPAGGVSQFQVLLESPIERGHTVTPGETFSGMVSRLFSIGPSGASSEYKTMELRIKQRNNIDDPNKIQAGQMLLIPDLPPRTAPSTTGPGAMPRVSMGPRYDEVKSGAGFDFSRGVSLPEFGITRTQGGGSPYVIQWRWLPASVALAEMQSVAFNTYKIRNTPVSGPIQIRLAQNGSGQSAAGLGSDTSFVQQMLLRHAPAYESVLYIFDDSWPSQQAFLQSRDFFRAAVASERKHYYLGPAEWAPGLLAADAKTDFPFDLDARASHARLVDAALEPFSRLTTRVKVVHVPLFVEQAWSREFWQEILFLVQTARNKGPALEQPYNPTSDAIRTARVTATDMTRLLPAKVQKGVVTTDQAVISALLEFAHMHAVATGKPFFLNMSWTVLRNTFDFQPNADSLGLALAAAGNQVNSDIIVNRTLFAYRAKASPGDVVAVMNTAADGSIACGSSLWSVPAGETFYGFAYEGALPNGQCGTSFSTPRVGWLLALREAYNAPVAPERMPFWFDRYRKFLLTLQDQSVQGYQRYWLSTRKVFDGL